MEDNGAGGRTMRAAGFFGLRDVRLIDVPHPGSPAPGEVLVKVAAVGICGSDHHYYNEGAIGGAIVDEGMIMGHEFSGWIADLHVSCEKEMHLFVQDTGGREKGCQHLHFCRSIAGLLTEFAMRTVKSRFWRLHRTSRNLDQRLVD